MARAAMIKLIFHSLKFIFPALGNLSSQFMINMINSGEMTARKNFWIFESQGEGKIGVNAKVL